MQIEMLVVLFLLSWLAATISGAAGFGGALLLLPILTNVLGAKTAVPVLTIMQLIGNLTGLVWTNPDRLAASWSILAGCVALRIPRERTVHQLAEWMDHQRDRYRAVGDGRTSTDRPNQVYDKPGRLLRWRCIGFLSGVAGSAGPLGAALFLGLKLPAVAYIASEAVTASAMHITKIVVYQRYALVGPTELWLGAVLGSAMVVGTWTGKRIIERMSATTFRRVVELLLVLSALQLIFFAE